MSLFQVSSEHNQPRAAKYRPQSFEQFFGQEHLLWENGVLKKLIEKWVMMNAIFRGQPGSGKTTLAELIAQKINYHYEYLNATKASTADIKQLSTQSQQRRALDGRATLLFLDEIHRFNKLQQDALLPDLENGNIILIGATTENPYYSLNNALLSRCLAFEFKKLDEESLLSILSFIVEKEKLEVWSEILEFIASTVEGDARSAINLLQMLANLGSDLSLEQVKSLIPTQKSYHQTEDKYNTISAMIKSIRGSDPDAAIYRMAKMLSGGEDPEYIARRLVILAAEDIGLANPQALPIAMAAMHAAKELWMPEIRIPLAEVAIYLALSPKSNSAYNAINLALSEVEHAPIQKVPAHLTKLWASNYKYPHDYPNHWIAQDYLSKKVKFYTPADNKFESAAQEWLKKIKK